MKNKITFILLALVFVFSPCLGLGEGVKIRAASASIPGFEFVYENDSTALCIRKEDASIAVINKKNGYIWRSNPKEAENEDIAADGMKRMTAMSQLTVEYLTKTNTQKRVTSYVGSARKGGLAFEPIDKGILVTYTFPDDQFIIPVRYSILDDGAFQATILNDQIQETGVMKIISIDLLPYFGAATVSDEGFILVPDGSGAKINLNNGRTETQPFSMPIYGRDNATNQIFSRYVYEEIRMPIFGLQKGNNAFMAIVDRGEGRGSINADISQKGIDLNYAYCSFAYRVMDSITVKEKRWDATSLTVPEPAYTKAETFSVRYYLINECGGYEDMAAVYREYLLNNNLIQRSQVDAKTPLYITFYGSIIKKSHFLGFPVDKLYSMTKYSEAEEIVDELVGRGIQDMVIRFQSWQKGGPLASIPKAPSFESSLGGKSGFNSLLQHVESLGSRLYLDVDFTNIYKSSFTYNSQFHGARSITRTLATQYAYRESTYEQFDKVKPWYLLEPSKAKEAVMAFSDNAAKMGLTGFSMSTLGNQLYSDFGGNDRGISRDLFSNALAYSQEKLGSMLLSDPNEYAFAYANYITDAPAYASGFDIENETVPFYQMVLHGVIPYSMEPANFVDNDRVAFLESVQYGGGLQYMWTKEDSEIVVNSNYGFLRNTCYTNWIDEATQWQKELDYVLSQVSEEYMIKHEEIAPNVFETTYGNGISFIVNYNNSKVNAKGKTINEKDYVILGGVPYEK